MQIAILGRQAGISLAELESLYGARAITPIGNYAALINSEEKLPQPRLGGTIKSAKLLTKLGNTDLDGAFSHLQSSIPDHLSYLPEGKLQFGVSVYGFKAQKNWLLRQMLELKKIIRKNGRSVRIIENKSEILEAAQVLYNKLTGPLGWELLIIKDGDDVLLAQTYAVQDIDAYAKRDHGRPKRDAKVGMLPPKLAQIMLNLATGKLETEDRGSETGDSSISDPQSPIQVLDPFCGTGVVLQEALLMGYEVFGTDLSPRMIDYTLDNLTWFRETYGDVGTILTVEQADATTHQWLEANIIDAVVCETYLGKPLSTLPNPATLEKIVDEANATTQGFLQNIASQLNPGTQLCLALPAWKVKDGFLHLKALDSLEKLGYTRLSFAHVVNEELIYHREGQIVGRELIVVARK